MRTGKVLTDRWPILAIVFLPIVMHIPVWVGISDFYSGEASDLIPYFYGTKVLLYQSFQENLHIPLWNPHIMFGQPIVGNIQYCLFYPLNAIFLFIPFFKALAYYQTIHLIIAGIGTYYLCQYTGCKKKGSTLAALLVILNGRMIYYINAGWLTYFTSISWIPLFVLFSLKTIEKRDLYWPAFLGVVFALTFLSGTPQYALLGFCLFLVNGICHLVISKSGDHRLQLLFRICITALISFLLIGVQLFPAMEQVYLSTRGLMEGQTIGFHFQWDVKEWIRILLRPEFLRHDFTWELCAYIGIGGIALAILGLIPFRKNLNIVFVWGIIPWLLSMGDAIPILSSITKQIPGISMMTNPSRYFIFTIITLCLLSGHGFDYILNSRKYWGRSFVVLTMIGLVLILIGVIVKPYAQGPVDIRYFGAIAGFLILSVLCIWRGTKTTQFFLICWLIIDPAFNATKILSDKYHIKDWIIPSKIINALNEYPHYPRIASIQPRHAWNNNLLTPFDDWVCIEKNIDRASGYEPLGMLNTHLFAAQMDGTTGLLKSFWGFRLWSFGNHRLFDVAGITHLVTSEPLNDSRLKLVTQDKITMPHFHGGWWRDKNLYLYENIHAFPRAFFLKNEREVDIMPVNFKSISPNHRQLTFRANQPGTVVISESFHPGWVARENEVDIPLNPFLNNFISFNVLAGEHDIMIDFRPQSLRIGCMFTLIGLGLIVLCLLYRKMGSSSMRRNNQNAKNHQLS